MAQASVLGPLITSRPSAEVNDACASYERYHKSFGGDLETRNKEYEDMVNTYYDISTVFYEYGWGSSFHFAHRYKGESHECSIKRHEHYLALKLGLQRHSQCLDVGCGVGGPLREIALFSGASITGLNNNAYQLARAQALNREAKQGIADRCKLVKADFMKMPFHNNKFDSVYEIDATCHAPDLTACYKEIFRVLKPGGCFAGYEWCSTEAYSPANAKHQHVLSEIELGNGLPEIRSVEQIKAALKAAGFEIVDAEDLALTADIPWFAPLDPQRLSITEKQM